MKNIVKMLISLMLVIYMPAQSVSYATLKKDNTETIEDIIDNFFEDGSDEDVGISSENNELYIFEEKDLDMLNEYQNSDNDYDFIFGNEDNKILFIKNILEPEGYDIRNITFIKS